MALLNEHYCANLNSLRVNVDNPSEIITQKVVPANRDTFWIRELSLFDTNGDILAITRSPTDQPELSTGTHCQSYQHRHVKIAPSVKFTTRDYIDSQVRIVPPPIRRLSVKTYGDHQQAQTTRTAIRSDITTKAYRALSNANATDYR